jgi:DNA-binding MarR family transcriptional regulator
MAMDDTKSTANPLDGLLGYQVRRAWMAMSNDLTRALTDLDLTITEMAMLLYVEANPHVTQSEVGRALSIQRANVVPLTSTLCQRDLIRREAMDGRSQALTLSAKGRTVARDARRRVAEHEKRFLTRVPAAERARLTKLLNLLWDE